MSVESINKVLKDFGLTEKEAEIYIFLAKHGTLKGGELVTHTKTHRGLVYRILKSFQTKGLVETSAETPVRFTAIPFERILDANIKAKREEAEQIEKAREHLLEDWRHIQQTELEPPLQRFAVIEGRNRIYSKIIQMIKDTKDQLSVVTTISGLVRVDQLGILDVLQNHPLKSKVQFRFLTEMPEQNLNLMKTLLKETSPTGALFRIVNPDLSPNLSSRMVIKDDAEIVFFVTQKPETSISQDNLCIWTNCKDLVQAFAVTFEELWRNSADSKKIIAEIETGTPVRPNTFVYAIDNPELARKRYRESLFLAKEEVVILTSSQGLIELLNETSLVKEWTSRELAVRIMAPITNESLQKAMNLPKHFEVRHVPIGYTRTTIIDERILFQFRTLPPEQEQKKPIAHLENMFSTADQAIVYRIKTNIDEMWTKAHPLTKSPIESEEHETFTKLSGYVRENESAKALAEKDVLDKIVNAKKIPLKGNPLKYTTRLYGSRAVALIHPPDHFKLPDMRIAIYHLNKKSSFGAEDFMQIHLLLRTRTGNRWVSVAHITDNPRSVPHRKIVFAGSPAERNIQVVKNDEFEVSVQGNTMFAGWAISIPLLPPHYILPPSCIQFDGYGDLKTGIMKMGNPSGRQQTIEYNGFDAFVTFYHPSSKYSGPGTDGLLFRDMVMTAYPPA